MLQRIADWLRITRGLGVRVESLEWRVGNLENRQTEDSAQFTESIRNISEKVDLLSEDLKRHILFNNENTKLIMTTLKQIDNENRAERAEHRRDVERFKLDIMEFRNYLKYGEDGDG